MGYEIMGLRARTNREEILAELFASQQRNNVVGLFFKDEDEMLTTSVRNIGDAENGDKFIHLQSSDLHGYPIKKTPVLLSEIKSLIPFKTLFDDAVYVRIRERTVQRHDHRAA